MIFKNKNIKYLKSTIDSLFMNSGLNKFSILLNFKPIFNQLVYCNLCQRGQSLLIKLKSLKLLVRF